MGLFDKLGGGLIASAIKSEAMKAIDRYVESAVINSVLPQCTEGTDAKVQFAADLKVMLVEALIEYTEIMGKNGGRDTSLNLPLTEKSLVLASTLKAKKPSSMAASEKITANDLDLSFSGKIAGLGFTQMMMGAGARINSVKFKVTVSGTASADWLDGE